MDEKWVRDTGLLFVLFLLFFGYRGSVLALLASGALILSLLFAPSLIVPLAYLWRLVVHTIGLIMNQAFFGFIFILIVTPMGALKRFFERGDETYRYGGERTSAFIDRNTHASREVFERPY